MLTFDDFLLEMAADVQERGICQICGREQAVRDHGNITHHGYTVKDGWFEGTCPGQRHQPLQVSKDETERQIRIIEDEIPKLEVTIADMKSGKAHPFRVRKSQSYADRKEFVEWDQASPLAQEYGRTMAIQSLDNRVRSGRATIKMLRELITNYFGKPLKKVDKVAAPEPLKPGDVVNVAGRKNVTIKKIEGKRAFGVGPNLNGQHLDHVFWDENGREYNHPLRLARRPK